MSLSPELLAHLAAAQHPEAPGFSAAMAYLEKLDPKTLAKEDMPTLIALLDTAVTKLTAERDATTRQLEGLRTRSALNAYGQHK